MKNNTIQAIIATIALGAIVGFSGTKITGDYLTGVAVTVAYLAVAAVVAMAASDYRGSQRSYTA